MEDRIPHSLCCEALKALMRCAKRRIVAQQIVGPERREPVSHQAWCGEGCVKIVPPGQL
jgi:hypothetical protein